MDKELKWYTYYHDWNGRVLKTFNIFNHPSFRKDVEGYLKKYKDKEEFAEKLKSSLMYFYWSKVEWEIVIAPWVRSRDTESIKIDVYDQVMNNWDVFLDYVWNSKTHKPRRAEWDENSVPFCNVCPKCGLVIDRTAIKNNSGKLHFCPNCGNSMKN